MNISAILNKLKRHKHNWKLLDKSTYLPPINQLAKTGLTSVDHLPKLAWKGGMVYIYKCDICGKIWGKKVTW